MTLIPSIAGFIFRIGLGVYMLTNPGSLTVAEELLAVAAFTIVSCVPYGVTSLIHITRPTVSAVTATVMLLLELSVLSLALLSEDDGHAAGIVLTVLPILNIVVVLPVTILIAGAVLRLAGVEKS